jgi:hypothetical protein
VAENLFWLSVKQDIKGYMWRCDVFQRNKYDKMTTARLLQPLPILEHVWEDNSIDFIGVLPSSNGYSIIMVVVDQLTNMDTS